MTASESAAALAADGVDLVDEDDRGGELLRLVEKVADTACADADVELNEIRAGDREELNVCLSCDGLCKQSLARARRAYEQNALRNAGAEAGVFFRIAQKVDDFLELGLFLVGSCDV